MSRDQILNTYPIAQQPVTLYRITQTRYANLSGIGSAKYAGRWNVLNQEAIYTSTEIGTAAMETLVHLPRNVLPQDRCLMTIEVEEIPMAYTSVTEAEGKLPQGVRFTEHFALESSAQVHDFLKAEARCGECGCFLSAGVAWAAAVA